MQFHLRLPRGKIYLHRLGLNLTKWKKVGHGAFATVLLVDLVLGIRKHWISGGSLNDIINSEVWRQLQRRIHFKFTIIEEKRKDLGNKSLIDCEPQVTGEALALYVSYSFNGFYPI